MAAAVTTYDAAGFEAWMASELGEDDEEEEF